MQLSAPYAWYEGIPSMDIAFSLCPAVHSLCVCLCDSLIQLLVAEVTDPGRLVDANMGKGSTLAGALCTHTLTTVATVVLEREVNLNSTIEYTGIYWNIVIKLKYTGVYWNIVGYTKIYWGILEYTEYLPETIP